MKFFIILFFLTCIFAQEFPGEENVLIVNKDNFDSILKQHSKLFLEFYSPWCGHCKSMAPEVAKAATQLKLESSDIVIAKIDATSEAEISEKYHIQGYPTFKFFYDDKILNYTAGRTSNDILNWLKKKTNPAAIVISESLQLKQLINDQEFFLVGFYTDKESSNAKAFSQYAFDNDEILCYAVINQDLFAEYQISEDTIIAFKKYDDLRADLKGKISVDTIKSFVSENRLPLVSEFTQEAAQKIFDGDIKNFAIYFVDKVNDTTFSSRFEGFHATASNFKGKVVFMYVDIGIEDHIRILDFLGIKAEDCPTMRYVTLADDLIKYKPLNNDLSQQGIQAFVQQVLDGSIKPHLMSDELPADWDLKPVKILVAKNFHNFLRTINKNVLVQFYAPWCGHCKNLSPIWDELAEKLLSNNDIVVAKVDATTNEIEDVPVKSFPLIQYFTKNNGPITEFTGERNLEALLAFVNNNGKNTDDDPAVTASETKDEL